MARLADVTMATGLAAALRELDITADETVGVGDAANDQAFLRYVGLSVAVANASTRSNVSRTSAPLERAATASAS